MSLQFLEHSYEIRPLVGQDFGQRLSSVFLGVSQNHFRMASMRLPSKNMCSVRHKPMPNSTEGDGVGRLFRRVGVWYEHLAG